jgi:hypothetical protein
VCRLNRKGNFQTIYVRQSHAATTAQEVYRLHVFQLRHGPTSSADSGYRALTSEGFQFSEEEKTHLAKFAPKTWSKGIQSRFKISLAAGQLAGTILFERHDGKTLFVLLGSLADFTVGFDAVEAEESDSTRNLQTSFNPKVPGTNIVLEDHQVRVTTEQLVQDSIKYYMVDITIEPIYHALNPIDMIMDRMPMLQNEPGQRPHDARSEPTKGFRKLRSALNF